MASNIGLIVSEHKAEAELLATITVYQVAALERFAALNFNAMKFVTENSLALARAQVAAEDWADWMALNLKTGQPAAELALGHWRSVYDVAAQTHRSIVKSIEMHIVERSDGELQFLGRTFADSIFGAGFTTAATRAALFAALLPYAHANGYVQRASTFVQAGFAAAIRATRNAGNAFADGHARVGARN